ncbi:hypothetical protein AGMMS50293_22550 [Spirochaetia bacterium]|nr:hypothetical protein AGMMS50293_22550 [Spirochaetia bacterium]
MGNAVNIAARLEGANKQYCTGGIIISEFTRKQIGDLFVFRPLDRVRLVGIKTPIRLFELLDLPENSGDSLIKMTAQWEDAIAMYEQKDFAGGKNAFTAILEGNPSDGTALLYFNRCEQFMQYPAGMNLPEGFPVNNLTQK